MNCEQVEQLMADALGDELSESDRGPFNAHLADCPRCRAEYASNRRALDAMRSLPSPRQVGLRREGDRLILAPAPQRAGAPTRRWAATAARYAAVIVLAFILGYAARAARPPQAAQEGFAQTESGPRSERRVEPAASQETVRLALISELARDRTRPEFAKCMGVLFGGGSN